MKKSGFDKRRKPVLCFVVSSAMTVNFFLAPHVNVLSHHFEIVIFLNSTEDKKVCSSVRQAVMLVGVPIRRNINILTDFYAIFLTVINLLRHRPSILLSITPKAGIISAISGYLCGVRHRIHYYTGQIWATSGGLSRILLKSLDFLIYKLSTDVLVDSHSQLQYLVSAGVLATGKSQVLGRGSICGVDPQRFHPNRSARERYRLAHSICENDVLIVYLGRLKADKGIVDLVNAMLPIISEYGQRIRLFIVGADEENLTPCLLEMTKDVFKSITILPETDSPETVLQAADLLCLPSHREGFGQVIIEAAACGVPSVASNIYGLRDLIDLGVISWTHKQGDIAEMQEAIRVGIRSVEAGTGGSARLISNVLQHFASDRVLTNLQRYLLGKI